MRALALLVASIGLADSVNPSTVGPALFLATGRRGPAAAGAFTLGVFAVSLAGGLLVVAGPGQLLVQALPRPGADAKHLAEVIGGAILLVVAAALWLGRRRLADRFAGGHHAGRSARSAFVLGAGLMLVELPTAFPYFAAIAAIVSSGASLGMQTVLLLLFNVAFVAPLLAIMGIRLFAGDRAADSLERVGGWMRRQSATLVAGLLALLGIACLVVGIGGLA